MVKERGKRKTMVGLVTSDKMEKTVVVEITTVVRHPEYGKYIKHHKTVKAHDERNECKVGDRVSLMETRPLSKDKRWRVSRILDRSAS